MEQIRTYLQAHRLTLGWLAEQVGLSRNTVKKWTHVPAEHVLAIERLTGISRHDLRPDIFGPSDSQSARASRRRKSPTSLSPNGRQG